MTDNAPPKIPPYVQRWMQLLFGKWRSWDKWHDIVANNYTLGREHLQAGNLNDAQLRFLLVTWLDKAHADGWAGLGAAYARLGKKYQASKALRKALQLKSDHAEARDWLNKLEADAA